MKTETFKQCKKDSLYMHSAVPFIDTLLLLDVPLSAININDWHCNSMLRVYVTREYGRNNGGKTQKANINQFGIKAAQRLAKFYRA